MSDDEKRSPELEVRDGGMPERNKMRNLLQGTFLDVHGHNFMGSGLGFGDWSTTMEILRYERWYGSQAREERRRRMKYLIRLCAEQERLVEEDISATGLSEALIEHLIEGDWNEVRAYISILKFEEERHEWRKEIAPRFAKFVAIAQEAYDTRPRVFCPVCRRPAPKEHIGAFQDGRHVCPWCEIVHDDEGEWVEKSKAHLTPVEEEEDLEAGWQHYIEFPGAPDRTEGQARAIARRHNLERRKGKESDE